MSADLPPAAAGPVERLRASSDIRRLLADLTAGVRAVVSPRLVSMQLRRRFGCYASSRAGASALSTGAFSFLQARPLSSCPCGFETRAHNTRISAQELGVEVAELRRLGR